MLHAPTRARARRRRRCVRSLSVCFAPAPLQPVNPWLGSSWAAYIEYFQWSPENNINSNQGTVRPGDILYGNVSLSADGKSYDSYHSSSNGWSVRMNVPIQKKNGGQLKDYTILYVVFEKPANCNQYPPEGVVTFTDIRIEWEGKQETPVWTTGIVDDVCNNRAAIVNASTVKITWDTKGVNPDPELIAARQKVGMQRPKTA